MANHPFWRVSGPQFMPIPAKSDLAEYLEAVVLTFDMCVDNNYGLQGQLSGVTGVKKSRQDVSDEIKEFCTKEMFNNSRVYKYNLGRQIERLDFNNVVTQWAYMYVYMCRHVHLVYHIMSSALRARVINVFSNTKNSVCAIGAGPGSDVLGLLLFFRENGIAMPFSEINFLDRCLAWDQSWQSFVKKLPKDIGRALERTNYYHFDFFVDRLTDIQKAIIGRASFVTFVKSISPVSAWLRNKKFYLHNQNGRRPDWCWHSVHSILQCVRPGAMVLYVDNGSQGSIHRRLILESALTIGFQVLYDINLSDVRMPCDSFSSKCKQFMKYMDFRPCSVSGSNEALLLWKPYTIPRYN